MNLGEYLKSKRLESGKSLEQVAASTKIHFKILGAIEENRYSALPARTFTRGFIVNYAKALKIDPVKLLEEHHDFLELKFSERANRDQGHQGYAFEGKELEQNKRWMAVGAGIALVFCVGVLLVFKPQNHKRKEKHKEFEEETVASNTGDGDSENPSPAMPSVTPILPLFSAKDQPNSTHLLAGIPPLVQKSAPTPTVAPPKKDPEPESTPVPTASPIPEEPSPSPTPAASATPKADPLNKGDSLSAKETKRKITFQADADAWVRFKSDSLPTNMIILRKGRSLVVKAKESILIEIAANQGLTYKTKGSSVPVTAGKYTLDANGALTPYNGADLGSTPIPAEIPAPRGN